MGVTTSSRNESHDDDCRAGGGSAVPPPPPQVGRFGVLDGGVHLVVEEAEQLGHVAQVGALAPNQQVEQRVESSRGARARGGGGTSARTSQAAGAPPPPPRRPTAAPSAPGCCPCAPRSERGGAPPGWRPQRLGGQAAPHMRTDGRSCARRSPCRRRPARPPPPPRSPSLTPERRRHGARFARRSAARAAGTNGAIASSPSPDESAGPTSTSSGRGVGQRLLHGPALPMAALDPTERRRRAADSFRTFVRSSAIQKVRAAQSVANVTAAARGGRSG